MIGNLLPTIDSLTLELNSILIEALILEALSLLKYFERDMEDPLLVKATENLLTLSIPLNKDSLLCFQARKLFFAVPRF